jgi:hypothetical protein
LVTALDWKSMAVTTGMEARLRASDPWCFGLPRKGEAMSFETLERRLRELEDKEAIRQAIYAYARGADRCHHELIANAYHDDAWDDHGTFRGDKDTVVDIISSNPSGAIASMHHVGNILIELDGDQANVESYFFACQVREREGKKFTRIRAGRYIDRFERRDGRWRIAKRIVVDDWNRVDELVATAPELDGQCRRGTRDASDPSYDVSDFISVTS